MDLALLENNVPRQLPSNEVVIIPATGGQITARALAVWTEPERNAIGVYEIGTAVETVPSNKKVVGRELHYDQPSNTVKWYNVLADLPLSERKATMRAQVDARMIQQVELGYNHDFGPALGGVHPLDTRQELDTEYLDYRNACKEKIDAGQGTAVMTVPLRDKNEVDILVRANQGMAAMQGMRDREGNIVLHARSLRDQIRLAADHAALDAIDIEAGWPA